MNQGFVRRQLLTPGYLSNNIHMKTIHLRNLNNLGDKFAFTADVIEDSKVVASYADTARSLGELNATLKNLKERAITADKVKEDFDTLKEGEYVFTQPVEPKEVVLSAAEVAKQELAEKEQELRDAVEKAEWDNKVSELAKTDTNVATKLQAIKGKQDTISSVNLKG